MQKETYCSAQANEIGDRCEKQCDKCAEFVSDLLGGKFDDGPPAPETGNPEQPSVNHITVQDPREYAKQVVANDAVNHITEAPKKGDYKELNCPACTKKEVVSRYLWRNVWQCTECYHEFVHGEWNPEVEAIKMFTAKLKKEGPEAIKKFLKNIGIEKAAPLASRDERIKELEGSNRAKAEYIRKLEILNDRSVEQLNKNKATIQEQAAKIAELEKENKELTHTVAEFIRKYEMNDTP